MKSFKRFSAGLAVVTALIAAGCVPANDTRTEPPGSSASPLPPQEVTPEPSPEPTTNVDEYSQEINGVLYQGTEKAPVRIGTDAPGEAPALQAEVTRETAEELAEGGDKYLVYVFPGLDDGGFLWKVFGMSRHGSFRPLSASLDAGAAGRFPTRDQALAGPFLIDGRGLDRAEYLLFVEP